MIEKDNFFANVQEVAKLIPHGRITTYGHIASFLGMRRSSRMVGWAMSQSILTEVPAHRVVNRNGVLTGKHHFPTLTRMQELLEGEGILVREDQIVDFKIILWDPAIELGF